MKKWRTSLAKWWVSTASYASASSTIPTPSWCTWREGDIDSSTRSVLFSNVNLYLKGKQAHLVKISKFVCYDYEARTILRTWELSNYNANLFNKNLCSRLSQISHWNSGQASLKTYWPGRKLTVCSYVKTCHKPTYLYIFCRKRWTRACWSKWSRAYGSARYKRSRNEGRTPRRSTGGGGTPRSDGARKWDTCKLMLYQKCGVQRGLVWLGYVSIKRYKVQYGFSSFLARLSTVSISNGLSVIKYIKHAHAHVFTWI